MGTSIEVVVRDKSSRWRKRSKIAPCFAVSTTETSAKETREENTADRELKDVNAERKNILEEVKKANTLTKALKETELRAKMITT